MKLPGVWYTWALQPMKADCVFSRPNALIFVCGKQTLSTWGFHSESTFGDQFRVSAWGAAAPLELEENAFIKALPKLILAKNQLYCYLGRSGVIRAALLCDGDLESEHNKIDDLKQSSDLKIPIHVLNSTGLRIAFSAFVRSPAISSSFVSSSHLKARASTRSACSTEPVRV